MMANFLHAPLNAEIFHIMTIWLSVHEDLKKCSWDDVYSESVINSAWSKWKELFISVCKKHAQDN